MKEIHDIETSLLDADGSCRDINFEGPTWDGVEDMVVSLGDLFSDGSVTDHEYQEVVRPFPESLLAVAQGGGQAYLKGGAPPITRLQVFVCPNDDGTPFVELTFLPDDVEQTQDLRRDFIEWTNWIRARLRARRYYVRYENVSWDFGDDGPTSGVFFVSDETI